MQQLNHCEIHSSTKSTWGVMLFVILCKFKICAYLVKGQTEWKHDFVTACHVIVMSSRFVSAIFRSSTLTVTPTSVLSASNSCRLRMHSLPRCFMTERDYNDNNERRRLRLQFFRDLGHPALIKAVTTTSPWRLCVSVILCKPSSRYIKMSPHEKSVRGEIITDLICLPLIKISQAP